MAIRTLEGLKARYAHVLGELHKLDRDRRRARRDLRTLEQAIQIFEPEWSASEARPIHPHKPSRWGGRGVGMRTVLEVLKEAEGPLTVNEIARRTFGRRGKAVTQAELRPYVASLTGTLNRWNGKSVVCYGERP